MDKFDSKHQNNLLGYEKQIEDTFNKIINEITKLTSGINVLSPDKTFSFSDYPLIQKRVESLMTGLKSGLSVVILNGIETEWTLANNKNNELANLVFGDNVGKLTKEQYRAYYSTNDKARQAFTARKVNGLNLSDRVWNYTNQFKSEIEMGLDIGIKNGVSAVNMAKDLKQYLKAPDKLFRRVKDKYGNLHLSKNAKNYHPGQGVYRSSYKNARRLAVTETNMAYNAANYARWQQLDFVVGIEIKLSKNHTLNGVPFTDICDDLKGKYPKDFKFIGWHPHCRCSAVSILKTDEEIDKDVDKILAGENTNTNSVNSIKSVPSGFTDWIKDNKERANNWKSKPYFMTDNKKYVEKSETLKTAKDIAKERHDKRTPAQIQSIKNEWFARKAVYKYGNTILDYMGGISDIDTSKLAELLKTNNLPEIQSEAHNLLVKGKEILNLTYLDNPIQVAKTYSFAEAELVNNAVYNKIMSWGNLSDENYLKKIKYEIEWVEENKKYNTWKVAQDAYIKNRKEFLERIEKIKTDENISKIAEYVKTSKSPILKSLIGDITSLQKSGKYGDEILSKIKEAEIKIKQLEKDKSIYSALKTKSLTDTDIKKLLDKFSIETVSESDDKLRGYYQKIWNTLSLAEKNIMTKYTYTYSYLNEPLRGISYYGDAIKTASFKNDMELLTKTLSKFKTQENMVVRRGVNSWTVKDLGYGLDRLKIGDEFVDKGFLSTAVNIDKGFNQSYEFIIVVPKGSAGVYAEPFSHYTDNHKFMYDNNPKKAILWDGKTKEYIGNEQEWIGQRGSKFRVLKTEGRRITLLMLGQLM